MTMKQILASPAIVKRTLLSLDATRVRVSRMPSGGLDVRAVAPIFESEDPARVFNDALAAGGFTLPSRSILWLRAPDDIDPEDEALFTPPKAARPTWADALFLEPVTPTPPDERDFGQCRSVAFWGLKGGVGRTTALAHIASILGRRKPVLAVDLDLDSPGLVPTLCDMTTTGAERFDELLERAADPATSEDELSLAVGRAIVPAKDSSSVWVLGPVSADVEFVQRLLGPLSPGALYRSNTAPLRRILSIAIRSVSAEYLLIDARSGYCDESAMSVLDLADEVIVFASPAPSTFLSISPAIEALERSRCAIGRPEVVRFVAGMLPAEQTVRQRILDELLAVAEETRARVSKELATARDDLPRDVEIQSIEYSARIVDNEGRLMHGVIDGYTDLAERLSPRTVPPGIASVEPTFARQVLSEISIPTPQSEDENDPAKLEELFTVTGKLREFARHEMSLVLGAKGTGKTFLRRLCLQNPAFVARRSGMASIASTHFIGLSTRFSGWIRAADEPDQGECLNSRA